MSSNGNAVATVDPGAIMEQVIAKGDLSKLTPAERAMYYRQTCESMGLNPFTQPFEYITLQGKLTLYARRAAADQLRKVHGVTLVSLDRRFDTDSGMYEVSARMRDRDGREDEDISAVYIAELKGDARGNAMKKAVTQAKRRCTLSLCGLGWLDETEIEQIPDARRSSVSAYVPDDLPVVEIDGEVVALDTGEIQDGDEPGKAAAGGGTERPMNEVEEEYYQAIVAAESLKELDAVAKRIVKGDISHPDVLAAGRIRRAELETAQQPELVGAVAGEPGLDRHSA